MVEIESNKNTQKRINVKCPSCGEKTTFAIQRDFVIKHGITVDYDIRKAKFRVWCNKCAKAVKFSLISNNKKTKPNNGKADSTECI